MLSTADAAPHGVRVIASHVVGWHSLDEGRPGAMAQSDRDARRDVLICTTDYPAAPIGDQLRLGRMVLWWPIATPVAITPRW